jgi:AP-3 complex subunit mu
MPIYVKPQITYSGGQGRVHVMVGAKHTGDKAVTNVVVLIPFPAAMRAAQLTPNFGTVRVDTMTQVARWEIGKLPKDKTPTLEGTITLPPDFKSDESPTVRAEFVVKMLAASGLKVDGLAIRGVSYKPFKGIRASTVAGKFTVRCMDT